VYWSGVEALETLRSDDVVGPAGFPALVAIVTFILTALMILRPDHGAMWPSIRGRKVWLFLAIFLVYVGILPFTGFVIGTSVFLATMFIMLGVERIRAILTAGFSTAVFFLFFSTLLGVDLPRWLGE